MFKFKPKVPLEHRATFVRELKKLRELDCVQHNRLLVGGPSITDPIERSKGFQYALVSFHRDRAALEEYQASQEHHEYVVCLFVFSLDIYSHGCMSPPSRADLQGVVLRRFIWFLFKRTSCGLILRLIRRMSTCATLVLLCPKVSFRV